MAASWFFDKKCPAPTAFSRLVAAEIENYSLDAEYLSYRVPRKKEFEEILNYLYEEKSSASEKARGKRILQLENYINIRMAMLDGGREDLEKKSFTWEKLNDLFLSVIKTGF